MLFQNGQLIWQDGSPLIDNSHWYVAPPSGNEPSRCTANTHITKHWFGWYSVSTNPRVAHLMTEHPHHPLSAVQCVGYVATYTKKMWLSVPCNLPLSTVVMCHQVVPK